MVNIGRRLSLRLAIQGPGAAAIYVKKLLRLLIVEPLCYFFLCHDPSHIDDFTDLGHKLREVAPLQQPLVRRHHSGAEQAVAPGGRPVLEKT